MQKRVGLVAGMGEGLPGRGLEPLRIAPPDPKSGASANFATPALGKEVRLSHSSVQKSIGGDLGTAPVNTPILQRFQRLG